MLTSGNHDSAVRLGFGSELSEAAGIHLRTRPSPTSAARVLVRDAHGEVGIYGIPYLLPDAVMTELGAERSHASVLAARQRADPRRRQRPRLAAHRRGRARVRHRRPGRRESERDIRVGGIGDTPASVFAGCSATWRWAICTASSGSARRRHHGPATAGSPLAFSFSERHHTKSVTLAEIDGAGQVATRLLPAPVPRPLREVRGRLDDLLARADADLAELPGAWVKAVLTDQARPAAPMERLRERWPHTLVLDFAPEGGLTGPDADLARLAEAADPVEICGLFVEYVAGAPPDDGPARGAAGRRWRRPSSSEAAA